MLRIVHRGDRPSEEDPEVVIIDGVGEGLGLHQRPGDFAMAEDGHMSYAGQGQVAVETEMRTQVALEDGALVSQPTKLRVDVLDGAFSAELL
ncbi:hypothetical protein D3C73_817210 [compost metagenome]